MPGVKRANPRDGKAIRFLVCVLRQHKQTYIKSRDDVLKVGSVVQVKSYSEYVIRAPVDPDDGFVPASTVSAGTYVSIRTAQGQIIGIVSGVLHNVREDVLPYMPQEKQEVFMPYVADFRNSYITVQGIGNMIDGKPSHNIAFTPVINDVVELMGPAELKAFHMVDGGRASFSYYKKMSSSVDSAVVDGAISNLSTAMPECAPMLKALKKFTENKYETGRHR